MWFGRVWLAAPVAVALWAVSVLNAGPVAATDELETRTLSTYDVNADGGVHVTVAAQVANRDPSTQRRSSGRVFFYSAIAFAIHDAATNISARSGGARLNVDTRDRDELLRVIAVQFDRALYYDESIDITLEYDLAAVRAPQLLLNPAYAFVPAIGQGDHSLVQIRVPADRQVTITVPNCARTADAPVTYSCGTSTTQADYRTGGKCAFTTSAPNWDCAFNSSDFVVIPFEATAAALAYVTRDSRATLPSGEVALQVRYFAGDEAWAARVEDVVRRGLPVLEEANGFPYPGPRSVQIVESGYYDTHGYEGLANTQGRIRLTPVADDHTILHETSHLWSGPFASRWLAEGMADYTANVAAQRLGLKPEVLKEPVPAAPKLEEWGPLRSQIAVSRAERELEDAGYSRSLRFMELLAERAGARGIGGANALLANQGIRGTARSYLDALEATTGKSFADLFAQWALPEGDAALLSQRADAWTRTDALRQRAAATGLDLPTQVSDALRDWRFDRAVTAVSTANAALDAHQVTAGRAATDGIDLGPGFAVAFNHSADDAARAAERESAALDAVRAATERVQDERSPLMRVGLLGTSPDTLAQASRDALARGDFAQATANATTLQHRLDRAEQDGIIRLALAAGALIVLLAAFTWLRLREGKGGPGTHGTFGRGQGTGQREQATGDRGQLERS